MEREVEVPCKLSDSDSSDIFEPEYHTMKKLHLPIGRKIKRGAWTTEENKIYLNFIQEHLESFSSEKQRRMERVFCQLSEALNRKRTPDQCRTHHQKLLGRQSSVKALIDYLQVKIKDSEEYPCRQKTRFIGKFQLRKLQTEEVLRV